MAAFGEIANEAMTVDMRKFISDVWNLFCGRGKREPISIFAIPRGGNGTDGSLENFVVPPFMGKRPRRRGERRKHEPLSIFAIPRDR